MTEALADTPADLGVVRTEIGVGIADLRQALRSVAVHASPDKDLPVLQRVRLHITRDNVLVTATNRYTVAVAVVSVWHNAYDDDDVICDLTLAQVPEILAMFRSKGEKSDDEGDDDLRIRITDRYLVMTDVAGLFPGKEVTWPRVATEGQFPDVYGLTGRMLTVAGTGKASTLHTSGKLLALFKAAADAYDAPVVLEPTKSDGGAIVVSVGESFVGALMPIKPSDELLAQHATWRDGWHARLGQLNLATGEVSA